MDNGIIIAAAILCVIALGLLLTVGSATGACPSMRAMRQSGIFLIVFDEVRK